MQGWKNRQNSYQIHIKICKECKLKTLLNGSIAEILAAPDTKMQIAGLTGSIKVKNNEIVELIRQGVENRESRLAIEEKCRQKHDEVSKFQERLNAAKAKQQLENSNSAQIREIYDIISRIPGKLETYNDEITRKMVSRIKIISAEKAEITLLNAITLTVDL